MGIYTKYENKDERCTYPFSDDPLGYCWGYANFIDGDKAFKDFTCDGCEYWEGGGNDTNKS